MSLRLYAPGTRKGNKTWLARGSVGGRVYEIATGAGDEKSARRIAREFAARVAATPNRDRLTFAEAARRYIAYKAPARNDKLRIDRLVEEIGGKRVRDIVAADLHDLAKRLYPVGAAATRNRNVLRPAVTILHHAASEGLCDWIRVRYFPEPRPRPRALTPDAAAALIAAAETPQQRLLLRWLFLQGTRISATLALDWLQLDLDRATVTLINNKGAGREETFALHPEVLADLRQVRERAGRVFAWSSRSSLRRWLPRIAAKAGVRFTPHMARHTLGTMMAANGETLRAIMGALGHSQASSSLIYQNGDVEMVRAAVARVSLPQAKKLGNAA